MSAVHGGQGRPRHWSLEILDVNADAIAYAVLQYAMNTEAVHAEKGKGNFRSRAGTAVPERLGHLFVR